MKMFKFSYIISASLIFTFAQVKAQRNCGTVEYMEQLKNAESKEVLEQWILDKRMEAPHSRIQYFNEQASTIYQIPVVIHIIHNGEAIGTGSNISQAQILSQLEVLNEDFRRLNADSSNIPAHFKPLYSDIGFEFVLAVRTPDNQATNGITRTHGSQNSWSVPNDVDLKAQIIWPTEEYLNIWVAPLGADWLGWAQFPESGLLEGLNPPFTATTDGVVVNYNAFGSIDKDPHANLQSPFNLGRTATHEIGHFFGLNHIWGDGGCGIGDYVADTPQAESDYRGCPNMGASTTTCGSQDMFMNFMDYVNDECMNIFSLGQKERMLIVMGNSPRRLSLTKSLALVPLFCEDLALVSFLAPGLGICDEQITPIINVKNTGDCAINSAQISISINNGAPIIQDFRFYLEENSETDLTFNSIHINEYGNIKLTAKVVSSNGVLDKYIENNIITQTSLKAELVTSLTEDFSVVDSQWTVRTNQAISSFNNEQSVFYTLTNNAAVFNYYKSAASTDAYISPKLVVGSNPQTLLFDIAYASRENISDEFWVLASTDCGNSFADTLFELSNLQAITSPVAFYPSGAMDWRHIQLDLTKYIDQEVIFSFIGKSAGGNRILFDNIKVVDNAYSDIALIGLSTPAMLCTNKNEVTLWIENKGKQPVTSLEIETKLGNTVSIINYTQLNMTPGARVNISLPITDIHETTIIEVTLLTPDDNSTNNAFSQSIRTENPFQPVPFRERFEETDLAAGWTLSGKGTDQTQGWALANNRLSFDANLSPAKGLQELVVLPPLDLKNLKSASIHFDFAYAYNGSNEELLRVKASTDCGETYATLLEQGGVELSTTFSSTPWVPSTKSDWKDMYVDLTEFAGNNNVQLIIELTSAQGNNAFVTNIEMFASNIIEPLQLTQNSITIYPNPASSGIVKIAFNLTEAQQAKLLIYNAQGRFVFEKSIETALNQTFEVSTANLLNGIYFVRLVGNQIDISRSFMVNQ